MPEPVKPTKAPEYPRRRRRARETRTRVLEAARILFIGRGYVGTTIEAIAARADVAPETVYAAFGNKRSILSAIMDASIAGDIDARPLLEQDWVAELRTEPDPRRRVEILARNGTAILGRRHAVDEVVRGAAASDPDLAAMRDRGKTERRAGQLELLRIVVAGTGLRSGLDLETAGDIVYALGSPETYRLLVIDRGWSPSRFEQWYAEAIQALLA